MNTSQSTVARIAVADDDADMIDVVRAILSDAGHEITSAGCAAELDRAVREAHSIGAPIDLIVSDVSMPDASGPEVCAALTRDQLCPAVILMSAFGDAKKLAAVPGIRVVAVLEKPFDVDALLAAVELALSGGPELCAAADRRRN